MSLDLGIVVALKRDEEDDGMIDMIFLIGDNDEELLGDEGEFLAGDMP